MTDRKGEVHAYVLFSDPEQVTECSSIIVDWGDEERSTQVSCPPDFDKWHTYKQRGEIEVIAMVTYVTSSGHKSPYVTGRIIVK